MPPGCLALALVVALVLLLPVFLANVILLALAKLGLSPGASLLVLAGMLAGGLVNVPLRHLPRGEPIEVDSFGLFGFGRVLPRSARRRTTTVLAVNVGGCIVPASVAAYELARIAAQGATSLLAAGIAIGVNTAVCYRLARPLPRVGIALPALVPAVVAALCALLLARDFAPPVAFSAGVLGPLLGADLLHLRQVARLGTGIASIGGAGTFDGIVMSGLLATLLA